MLLAFDAGCVDGMSTIICCDAMLILALLTLLLFLETMKKIVVASRSFKDGP